MTAKLIEPRAQTAFLLARYRIDHVLDVGANTGQFANSLRQAGYDRHIISFEPQTEAHTVLTAAAVDDLQWRVAPRGAIGDRDGEITINISRSSDMSSALEFTAETHDHFASDRFVATETAPLHRLETLWPKLAIGDSRVFLKSDTQGFDLNVLRGAGRRLDEIVGVQVEASLHPIYQGQPDYRAFLDYLLPRGFAVMQIIPGYFSRHHGRMLEVDLILFRPHSAD